MILGGWRRGEGRAFIEIDLALDGRRSPSLAEGSICNMRVSGTSLSAAAASRDARESPGRPGRGGDGDRDEAAKAKAEGERAFAAAMAIGQIVVTAGYSGEICVFENVGSPQWL